MNAAARPCPLCSSGKLNRLHTQDLSQPAGSPLPDRYHIVACQRCGFVFADTPVPQAGYDRYYAEFSKYEDAALATGGGDDVDDRQRLETLAAELSARVPSTGRILDVGCARGGLLAALRQRGYTALHGVDASAACIQTVANRGFAAHCLPLTRLQELTPLGPFDGIVVSHVLEHVVELQAVVGALASLLDANGRLYVETPDAGRYGHFPFVPFYFFDSEHINHFDIPHLCQLGQQAGLTAVATRECELTLPGKLLYPACGVWFAHGGESRPPGDLEALAPRVAAYVTQCIRSAGHPGLLQLADSHTEVLVWGAGAFAQRLFGSGLLAKCTIVGIMDNDRGKQGREFAGFPILAPAEALTRFPGAAVVIAAAIHTPAIAAELERLSPGRFRITLADIPASAESL